MGSYNETMIATIIFGFYIGCLGYGFSLVVWSTIFQTGINYYALNCTPVAGLLCSILCCGCLKFITKNK